MNNVRREKLRAFLEANQVVTINQMKEFLPEVSLMTIHRDLDYLQERGLAVKIRGGARYVQGRESEPVFSAREIVNRPAKQRIAKKAVPLLSGSSSIFLDAGTTVLAFARAMPDLSASIVTSGPNIALELCRHKNLGITVCGGTLHKNNLMLTGSAALETLSGINIDIAFLVASGYSSGTGFSCGRESEAEVKRLVTEKARTRVMLLDTSKLGRVFPHTFAHLDQLDAVVTEREPSDLPEEFLKEAGVCPKLRII